VREFAEGEIAPHVMEWDEASHFLPSKLLPKLAEMGLLGVIFPEEYGGNRSRLRSNTSLSSKNSRAWMVPLALFRRRPQFAVQQSTSINLAPKNKNASTPPPRPPRTGAKKLGAWSLTEPEAGSDAGGTRSTAVRNGNSWVLNGSKTFTTNGHYADTCVAMAVTDKAKGSHGISAFILEKGMPGFRPGKKENKLGMRASDTSEVIFTDCKIPAENLLGPEGEGFTGSLKILDGGRISIAALGLGMAQGALDAAVCYAKQRKQFGKAISEFQLFSSSWRIWPRRWKRRDCSFIRPRGLLIRTMRGFTRESSMAKLFASEVAVRVANECVQIHGATVSSKTTPPKSFTATSSSAPLAKAPAKFKSWSLPGNSSARDRNACNSSLSGLRVFINACCNFCPRGGNPHP